MNMNMIAPEHFDEVWGRVQEGARKKHQEYLERIKVLEDRVTLYKKKIEQGSKYFHQDELDDVEKELKSANYWLDKHIDENSHFIA